MHTHTLGLHIQICVCWVGLLRTMWPWFSSCWVRGWPRQRQHQQKKNALYTEPISRLFANWILFLFVFAPDGFKFLARKFGWYNFLVLCVFFFRQSSPINCFLTFQFDWLTFSLAELFHRCRIPSLWPARAESLLDIPTKVYDQPVACLDINISRQQPRGSFTQTVKLGLFIAFFFGCFDDFVVVWLIYHPWIGFFFVDFRLEFDARGP